MEKSANKEKKECNTCKETKLVTEFYLHPETKKRYATCKECRCEYQKNYYKKNRLKVLNYCKRYYRENKIMMQEYHDEWKQRNRQKLRKYSNKYYHQNKVLKNDRQNLACASM